MATDIKIQAPMVEIDTGKGLERVVRRERQLAYGSEGTGKSYIWQSYLAATPDDVIFYVIDTDGAWEPAAGSEQFKPFRHRVKLTVPRSWSDYRDAVVEAMNNMGEHDWFVLDMGDSAWKAAQHHYHSLQDKTRSKEGFQFSMIEDQVETSEDTQQMWGKINEVYAPMQSAFVFCPGHLFIAATAKELKRNPRGDYFRETRDNIRDYGSVGYRPGGQKHLGHDVSTVLFLKKEGDRRVITMIKDRNREEKWDGTITHTDASRDILMARAGWMPVVD